MKKHTLAVTGALGYSGRYIASLALKKKMTVLGLTNSMDKPNPDYLDLASLSWDREESLVEALSSCEVLINTYWVRFNHKSFCHEEAVENTKRLINAARKAGVKRMVHVSITNPDPESGLSYFRGKAELEEYLLRSGLPCSILRPAVLFGETPEESILMNNMAWSLRRFPFMGYFGSGKYRLQPIHVQDFAELAVEEAFRPADENRIVNAVGPEIYEYAELLRFLGKAVGVSRPLISLPPSLGYQIARLLGWFQGDVLLTREEITGLMEDRLVVENAPYAGSRRLSEWVSQYADSLGRVYASEIQRRKL